jgi:hypothetical protein
MVVCDAAPTIASVMHVMRCGGSCKCTVYGKLKPMQLHLALLHSNIVINLNLNLNRLVHVSLN